eukprot:Skav212879  [mRNA]  locus=scaffold1006:113196:127469:+ [translate_table: standard]
MARTAVDAVCLIAVAILRVILTRPRRGSVVWVVAVLTLAATCPAFVGSPYRLSLANSVKERALSEQCNDWADQVKTAGVAGAVAFFLNCGVQGVSADATSHAYAATGSAMPVLEQRISKLSKRVSHVGFALSARELSGADRHGDSG